jgi:predicted RNase H-like HicB family nuclease
MEDKGKTSRTKDFKEVKLHTEGEWQEFQGNAYSCQVYLLPEQEGGYSAIAATLPGVASQGETEEEALENITEALAAAISAYKDNGMKIPWRQEPREPEPEAKIRWVAVHV